MALYKATKEGWDGRQIRTPGEVFSFDGKKGSWMVECDSHGNPLKGEAIPPPQREIRAGAKQPRGHTRDDLRAELKKLGIKFPATAGAVALAELLKNHHEGAATPVPVSSEDTDGGAPGVGSETPKGTGDQDVI